MPSITIRFHKCNIFNEKLFTYIKGRTITEIKIICMTIYLVDDIKALSKFMDEQFYKGNVESLYEKFTK